MGNCVFLNTDNLNQKYMNIEISKKEKIRNQSIQLSEEELTRNLSTKFSSENAAFFYSFEMCFLKEINLIRENPKKFAIKLKELTKNIIKENDQEYLYLNKNNLEEKILLKKGKTVFKETINYLEQFNPVNKLIYNENLKVTFEENIKLTKENIGKLILNKRLELLQKYKKCFFNIGIIKIPKMMDKIKLMRSAKADLVIISIRSPILKYYRKIKKRTIYLDK